MMIDARILTLALLFAVTGSSFASAAEDEAPKAPAAVFSAADAAFKASKWDEAEELYQKAAKSIEASDRAAAWDRLEALYRKIRSPKKAERAAANAREEKALEKRLVPEDGRFYEPYKLAAGDTYGKIAKKSGVSQKWLMAANGNQKLIEGRTIRVPKFRDLLIVDKKTKRLTWKRDDDVIAVFPVSVGKLDTQTPEGKFMIVTKIRNPVWYHNKEAIPPESPKNLLGTRWMGLNHKGYGIHGTRDPDAIGAAVSHGCVRMRNYQVEELFAWIPVGTRVIIRSGDS